MAILSKLVAIIGADTTEFREKLKDTERRFKSTARRLESLGRDLTVGVSLPLAAAGAAAFKFAADFDKAMARSTAIMGDVSDAMRRDLEGTARDVAKSSTFAAREAAEAYFFLASAGLDSAQSLKALPQVVKFATAGAFDLARATDLATDAQSAMGLTVKDQDANLANLTRTTDALVKANTLANASTEQFAQALTNQAGPMLRIVNKSIEEGLAILSAFADQGIKAEEAGTKLAIVLRDLQKSAQKAPEAFEKYGIAVFDANGAMRDFADILADIENALKGKSTETRRAILTELEFQEKSVASTLALVGYSNKIREWHEQLRRAAGTVDEVARKQLANMSDQLTILKNKMVDLAITLGKALQPAFTLLGATMTALVRVLSGLGRALEAIPATVRAIVGGIGAFLVILGPLIYGIGKIYKVLGGLAGLMTKWGGILTFLKAHPIAILITALAALGLGFADYVGRVQEATSRTRMLGAEVTVTAEMIERAQERVSAAATAEAKALEDLEHVYKRLAEARALLATGGTPDQTPAELQTIIRTYEDRIRQMREGAVATAELARRQADSEATTLRMQQAYDRYSAALQRLGKVHQATGDKERALNDLLAAKTQLFDELIPLVARGSPVLAELGNQIQRLTKELAPSNVELETQTVEIDKAKEAYDDFLKELKTADKVFAATADSARLLGDVIAAKTKLFEALVEVLPKGHPHLVQLATDIGNLQTRLDKLSEEESPAEKLTRPSDLQLAAQHWEDFIYSLQQPVTQLSAILTGTFSNFTRGFGTAFGDAVVRGEHFGEAMEQVFTNMGAQLVAQLATMAIEQIAYHTLVEGLLLGEAATHAGVKAAEVATESAAQGTILAERLAVHIQTLAMWAVELAEFIAMALKMIYLSIVQAWSSLGPFGWLIGMGVAAGAIVAILAAVDAFAEGGIVMGPRIGLVGEAGPEAIIPLDRLGALNPGAGETTVVLEMEGRTMARLIVPHVGGTIRRRIGN